MKKFLSKIALFTLLVYLTSWGLYALLHNYETAYYSKGMKTRWIMGLREQKVDYLFLGSSRMANTVACKQIDSILQTHSLNIATPGSSYGESYVLLYEYLKNGNSAKTLVLSLDLFKNRHRDYDEETVTTLVFKKFDLFQVYDDPRVREAYADYSKPVNMWLWDYIPFSRYAEYNSYFKFNDLVAYGKGERLKSQFDTVSGEQLVKYKKFDGKRYANPEIVKMGPRGEKYLLRILDLAKTKHMNIILVTAPYYAMLPLNRKEHAQFVSFLQKKYNAQYLDFSVQPEWKDKQYFSDAIHTNEKGSRIFTKELADSLR